MMVPFPKVAPSLVPAAANATPRASAIRDPLDSPMWKDIAKHHLAERSIVFDERVQVLLPYVTANQSQVPIAVDARSTASTRSPSSSISTRFRSRCGWSRQPRKPS